MVNIDRTRTYSYTDPTKEYNKCRGSTSDLFIN